MLSNLFRFTISCIKNLNCFMHLCKQRSIGPFYCAYFLTPSGITRPEILIPVTAHPAFDKAANYFGLKVRHIPLTSDYIVDVAAMRSAISGNTVMLVGSVPNFPYGTMDDIQAICELGMN